MSAGLNPTNYAVIPRVLFRILSTRRLGFVIPVLMQ
jgi:hypothetical protein